MKWRTEARRFVAIMLVVMMVGLGSGQSVVSASETTSLETGARVQNNPADGTYQFSDNVENPADNNWLADSPWARTTTDSHSENTSWTDSQGDYYGNNIDVSLTLATSLNLSSAVNPNLKFWHHYQIEAGFDFGYVEISTNAGANWTALATYSGTQTSPFTASASVAKTASEPGSWQAGAYTAEPWVMEQIDLSTYTGQSDVKIRFRLVTDGSTVRDGWYIDDVAIAELPAAVTLSSTANATRTSLDLSWSQNTEASFSSYVIYRGLSSNVSFRNTRVTAISSQNTTAYTDTGLTAKTTYYYKVYVVNNYEIYSASNEQSGTTLAGLDYPLFDDMEAGPNNWVAEPSNVWTLVTPDLAHSGNKAWTDSPSGDYGNSVNASLTLSNDIDINPLSQLVFWQRLKVAAGDQALVELSTNASANWTILATFTNQQINSWTRVQLGTGNATATARVRFRLLTDGAGTAGGWDIDDVGLSDLPTAVALDTPVPQIVPNIDKMRLTWTPNNDIYFQSYQIYRDTQAGVALTDTLVATINNQTTTTYLDSGLLPNTKYYYKVYVLNPGNAFNGSNEVNATTLAPGGVIGYPFFDNMENGVGNWVAQSPWALTQEYYHSGNTSWTDSPGLGYNNNASTSLQISTNLGSAVMPVLDFWQKYSLEQNKDFGYIEVSTNNGTSWSRIYFVTGGRPDWEHEQVDLGGYTGLAQVMLRFRLVSDASGTADGWYIDDVSINETGVAAISYPFSDNMDSGSGNWLSGSWELVTPGHSTPNAWTDSPAGDYLLDNWMELVLGNTVNLTGATKPQLTFWHKYSLVDSTGNDNQHDYGRVYVSNLYGQAGTWQQLAAYTGTQSDWTMVQLDLSAYVGLSSVRIKFVLDDNRDVETYYGGDQSRQADGWYIDDIRLQDAPTDVVLAEPANVTMHSADLSWTQNTEANFARYEVYRNKSAAATRSSTLVATITNSTNTTFTDVYTILQPDRYHYRVWVVDQLGRYSLGSNDVTATYTVPLVDYPFQDNMETGTANWEWSAPWGQTTAFAYSGNTSWTDSPLGGYGDNANTALNINISLSGADSPVLTFWHQYSLEENLDYGYVEVSTNNGTTWTQLFVVSGNGDWKQERVRLSAYTGSVIGLRFRLTSNGNAITGDGWYIDDVNIGEGLTSASYPFFDNMESGMGAWFYSSPWGQTTDLSHSGNTSWTDSPFGSYANNANTSLWTTVDLSSVAVMPVLDFWHKYSFEQNKDFGYIEASINGGSTWSRIYFVTGGNDWVNEQVDLSGFVGQAQVMLRFRLVSDASGQADGWYIDDVSINETAVATISYPFSDNMDSGGGNWLSSSWELVTPGHTTPNAWTDSPAGDYLLDNWMELVLGSVIDLRGTTKPQLTFWHKYSLVDSTGNDNQHDYGRVYVSNYNGQSGTWYQLAAYTGTQSDWTMAQLDLSAYVGLSSVRIKFVLDDNRDIETYYGGDQSRQADGWYLDDIRLQDAPTDVVLAEPTNVTMHSADLSWTQNTEAGFARYEVYRNKSAATTRSSTLVATITNQANTAFTDVYTILQPDRYHYRVWVVDQLGRYSLGSNDVTATYTVPQVGFPFLDNMEAGTANWEWSSPWGQATASAHSPATAWSDSPVGAYADNANTALTTNINLSEAGSPILTFWHRYSLEQDLDYGYVEVSTTGGSTWTQVFVVTGNSEWKWEKVNLTPYAGAVIGLRFRLTSNGNGITGDGWYIDDVNIGEGLTSAVYPFFDNMESGMGAWFYSSPWGQTTALSHSANTSWTDSPFGSYVNNANTSLWTTINLSVAVMPMLDFWHKYSLERNKDFGYIEASINNGTTWSRIYFVTGGNDWVKEQVDLSGYTGQAQVMLRFRLVSDASGTADGWYIDDVTINETPITISYPFFDNMDSGPDKWLSSSWGLVTPGYSTPNAWTDSPEGDYLLDNWMELVLGSVIDLRGTTKPQLTFWHKYSLVDSTGNDNQHDYGRVYVSNYYGQSGTWQQLAAYTGTQSTWTRVKLDLSAYVGLSSVRIKFVLDDNRDIETYYGGDQSRQADGWYIDDVRISEADTIAPADITNLAVTGVTANSATLVWTAPGDDGNSGTATQYDLRYLAGTPITEANWATANQTTGEPTPLPSGFTQSHIVGGLTPDTTYYFAIKAVDEDLNWSPLSNVVSDATLSEGVVTIRVDAPTYVLTQRDFTAKVKLNEVANFDAASYNVTFNSTVLQLTNVTAGLIGSTQIPVGQWSENVSGIVGIVQNVEGTPGISGAGYLAVLHFHVNGANSTSSQIGLTNGILGDNTAQEIPSRWLADSVQVTTFLPGDANEDEVVNALDLTKAERIIVGLDAPTPGADANQDGSRNALDLTLIERIIVGLQ